MTKPKDANDEDVGRILCFLVGVVAIAVAVAMIVWPDAISGPDYPRIPFGKIIAWIWGRTGGVFVGLFGVMVIFGSFLPDQPKPPPPPAKPKNFPLGPGPLDFRVVVPVTALLEHPEIIADPVFPADRYLRTFGLACFRRTLIDFDKPELADNARELSATEQIVSFVSGTIGFWAIDLEVASKNGITGKDEFISRVSEAIRRPPLAMAAFTAEQHILSEGVVQIQIAEGPAVPRQYEVSRLKTIGWYMAELVSPPQNSSEQVEQN